MWRNYLTVGLRALAKNKTYTFINVFGLALGLAACLLILLFVRYERSYDAALPGASQAYQLQAWYKAGDDGSPPQKMQMSAFVAGTLFKKDFPQVERLVYVLGSSPVILQDGQATTSDHFTFVDGPIFDILQLPFARGDRRTALDNPGSLVLTEAEAARRFGAADPVGKTLTLVVRGQPTDYRITGVVKDPPKNSHLALSIVARFDPVSYFAEQPDFMTQWGWQSGWVYVKLKPGADPAAIMAQMPAWEKRNIPDQNVGGEHYNPGDDQDWHLVNVRDVHLGEAQNGSMTPGNDRRTIATFAVIAVLVLGMACVNFTNLATARASQRAREVALRKVLGASRRQLIVQFLGESVLLAALAMLVALAMAELVLPSLNAFLKADMAMTYVGSGGLLLPIVVLVALVGAAGGLYPAFYLSRFQPAQVLKANKSSSDARGSGRLRNILVVSQFAVSIGLIICTAVVYAQTVYARSADPGYNREGLLQIENVNRRAILPVADTLLHEIAQVDGVKSLGRTTIGVATANSSNFGVVPPGATKSVTTGTYRVDPGFFTTMGIRFVAGRNFVEGRAMDDSTLEGFPPSDAAVAALAHRGYSVVLNELAARRLGFAHPADAIGKVLKAQAGDVEKNGMTPVTVVGVVADSRFRSVRDPVDPIMFSYDRIGPDYLVVRYSSPQPAAVRDRIERVWKRIAPDVPFEAKFADDIVRDLYDREEARAKMFAGFAGLAVVIGCLGLFGLASFTAERRTKEIGIRKVLGARTQDIVRLLVWQFSRPVLIANVIAWPIAWWLMRDWLNNFDARIGLNPALFVGAGLLALVIAAVTIIGHAMKVARANPIHALRYE